MTTFLRLLAILYLVCMCFAGITATTADETCMSKPGQLFAPCEPLDVSHFDDLRKPVIESVS